MLERIRALAMEKLASQEEVDAFMEGFEKEAGFGLAATGPVMGAFKTNAIKAGVGLGAALLGASIVKGVSSTSNAIDRSNLKGRFDMALAQVMVSNKIIKGANPTKVKEFANTFFSFAPHVASDPNLLGSILSNAVLGESIDPQTIKTLVELEGRYVDNNRAAPLVGIRT